MEKRDRNSQITKVDWDCYEEWGLGYCYHLTPFFLLEKFTELYEGKNGWKLPQEEKYKALREFIRFFEIEVTYIEAKFKFSQNKSTEDIEKVIMSLRENGQDEVAEFMAKANRTEE